MLARGASSGGAPAFRSASANMNVARVRALLQDFGEGASGHSRVIARGARLVYPPSLAGQKDARPASCPFITPRFQLVTDLARSRALSLTGEDTDHRGDYPRRDHGERGPKKDPLKRLTSHASRAGSRSRRG